MRCFDQSLKILFIQDIFEENQSLFKEIEKISKNIYQIKVSSLEQVIHHLNSFTYDMVIFDFEMINFSAGDFYIQVRKYLPKTPIILITKGMSEENVADMMKIGFYDIVHKDRIERIHLISNRFLNEREFRHQDEENQKMASEALASKEQMIAVVSHDIKNPISAIQLQAQMLLRASERNAKSTLGEEVKIQANRILKTTDRMKNLISDLLDKNKSENRLSDLQKENINVCRILMDVLDSLRPLIQEKEIQLRISIPENLVISIDRNKMFQVFSNLLSNAVKFTPQSGAIKLSIQDSENEFKFTVEDSGPGLSESECQKVFDKYWTGNEKKSMGTGLGLFICKTIIEAHGGNIFVENIPNAGARFHFSIPKFIDVEFKRFEDNKDSRKKIYIIDDDEDLREVMSWALSKEGYLIYTFKSPLEAFEAIFRGSTHPNLILVDYHMGEMSGKDFVLKVSLVESLKFCPILMISASPIDVEEEIPRELYREVITKPIDLDGLVLSVSKLLT